MCVSLIIFFISNRNKRRSEADFWMSHERATSVFRLRGKDKLLPFYSLVRVFIFGLPLTTREKKQHKAPVPTKERLIAWKIKHYWQTQIVLKVMWLHVCTKGEEEIWYAMLPRRLRFTFFLLSLPPLAGRLIPRHIERSEYEKQLVSSAIWRWPSQNINFFFAAFFFLTWIFSTRRRCDGLAEPHAVQHSVAHRRQFYISI